MFGGTFRKNPISLRTHSRGPLKPISAWRRADSRTESQRGNPLWNFLHKGRVNGQGTGPKTKEGLVGLRKGGLSAGLFGQRPTRRAPGWDLTSDGDLSYGTLSPQTTTFGGPNKPRRGGRGKGGATFSLLLQQGQVPFGRRKQACLQEPPGCL